MNQGGHAPQRQEVRAVRTPPITKPATLPTVPAIAYAAYAPLRSTGSVNVIRIIAIAEGTFIAAPINNQTAALAA